MCTPVIDPFVASADHLLRRKDPDDRLLKSIITILCNATDVTSQSKGKKICGKSQVIGPYKGDLPKIKMYLEGGIIVDIDCLNIIQQPTPIGKRNTVIESPAFFNISEDGSVKWPRESPHPPTKWIIHPRVLIDYLKLYKYYGFFKIENYYEHRNTFKKLSISCNGVYGYHDVLIQSFEEDKEFFEIRFKVSIGAELSTIGMKHSEYINITNIIKYRGTPFMHVKSDKGLEWNDEINIRPEYIKKHEKEILDVLHGKNIDEKYKNEFKNEKIIVETLGESDISEEDRKKGFEEFLVFVLIGDASLGINPVTVFNDLIIKKFINDDRIRTIEYCESGNMENLVKAHYIFHVVVNTKGLKEIIIDTIHKKLYERDLKCETNVILPADSLSINEHLSLLETDTNAWMKSKIKAMILYNIAETDPFVIKRLAEDELKSVCSIYENTIKLCDHIERYRSDRILIKAMKRNVNRFIYEVAHEILSEGAITEKNRERLDYYCGDYITRLSRDIETYLQKLLVRKGNELYGDENGVNKFEKKLQSLWNTKYKKRSHVVKIGGQTIFGSMLQYIVLWNKYGDENNKIKDDKFTENIKKLQKTKVVEFRGDFSHGKKEGEQLLPNLKNRDDIKKLLSAAEAMSNFAIEYFVWSSHKL